MGDGIGYVVVTYNQASGRPELDVVGLHPFIGDAEYERDQLAAATNRDGRAERHVVCQVVPLDGDDDR